MFLRHTVENRCSRLCPYVTCSNRALDLPPSLLLRMSPILVNPPVAQTKSLEPSTIAFFFVFQSNPLALLQNMSGMWLFLTPPLFPSWSKPPAWLTVTVNCGLPFHHSVSSQHSRQRPLSNVSHQVTSPFKMLQGPCLAHSKSRSPENACGALASCLLLTLSRSLTPSPLCSSHKDTTHSPVSHVCACGSLCAGNFPPRKPQVLFPRLLQMSPYQWSHLCLSGSSRKQMAHSNPDP